MKAIIFCLLICFCIVIFAGCGMADDDGTTNYTWYIKIYMPDGIIEGPGCIKNLSSCGVAIVEVDGIKYYVGSQNFLATKMPTP